MILLKDKLDDLASWICIIVSTRSLEQNPNSWHTRPMMMWAHPNHLISTYKFGSLDVYYTLLCYFQNSYYFSCLCTLYIFILLAGMQYLPLPFSFNLIMNLLSGVCAVKPCLISMRIFKSESHCRLWEHKDRNYYIDLCIPMT